MWPKGLAIVIDSKTYKLIYNGLGSVSKRAEGILEVPGDELKKVVVYDVDSSLVNESPLDIAILRLLRESPKYPRMLSRLLNVDEQKVYYHIRKLKRMGLIEEAGKSVVRGATAITYRARYDGYARLFTRMQSGRTGLSLDMWVLERFFREFIKNRVLDAVIVVGSPEPHGPYRASARDGHYSAQLALLLGRIALPPGDFIIKLDVDVRAEGAYDRNMIVIGGPGTNLVTAEINKALPVRFSEENYWLGLTDGEGRIYNNPSDAIIAKLNNPYDKEKRVVVLAGVRHIGTKTAVLALTRFSTRVLKDYDGEERFAVVVRGFDEDGDGRVDSVELLRVYKW